MDIKPIETVYNGYRFRSRLEARWAVFFDAAGVQYEYEVEGYVLNDGTKYLPDFYLPKYQLYVEIKPLLRDTPFEERKKICDGQEELCRKFRDSVGKAIFLQYGTPWDDIWGMLFAWDLCESGGGDFEDSARFIDVSPDISCDIVLLTFGGRPDRDICVNNDWVFNPKVCTAGTIMREYPNYACSKIEEEMTSLYYPNMNDPFTAARRTAQQARFEHGETPIVRRW